MTASFTDLAEGQRLLDAMREEEKNTGPHDPRPHYVEWLIWARNNAEHLLHAVEVLANRLDQTRRDYEENMRDRLRHKHRADEAEMALDRVHGTIDRYSDSGNAWVDAYTRDLRKALGGGS